MPLRYTHTPALETRRDGRPPAVEMRHGHPSVLRTRCHSPGYVMLVCSYDAYIILFNHLDVGQSATMEAAVGGPKNGGAFKKKGTQTVGKKKGGGKALLSQVSPTSLAPALHCVTSVPSPNRLTRPVRRLSGLRATLWT